MSRGISDNKKRRGRPATGVGTLIGLRWHAPELAAIDAWAAQQPDAPSRSEAIRRLVELGLEAKPASGRLAVKSIPIDKLNAGNDT